MYAASADIAAAYGQDALDTWSIRAGDEDGSQTAAAALTYAGAVIDARLSVRFALPLATVPAILAQIAVDLAVERLASDALSSTEQVLDRAKRARADLKDIAEGRMNLGLPALTPGESPRPVLGRVSPGGDKLFDRQRLRDF